MIPDEPEDDEDDVAPVPGMLSTSPEEAVKAEKVAAAKAAAEAEGPVVSDAKLKELKEKARTRIDARLKERRKKRRLLRGDIAKGS
jgi:hypothetical protein